MITKMTKSYPFNIKLKLRPKSDKLASKRISGSQIEHLCSITSMVTEISMVKK